MKWKKLLAGVITLALAVAFCSSAFAATSVSGSIANADGSIYATSGNLSWNQGACLFTATTSCAHSEASLMTSCTAQFSLYGIAVGPVQNAIGIGSATVGFGGNGYIYGLGGHKVWLANNSWSGETSA